MTTKKNVDRDASSEEQKTAVDSSTGPNPGAAGTSNIEPIITFMPAQRDKIISNDDSYIVLGGDRVSSLASGYAGAGDTGAHMIDLVVGRDPTVSGNPSFKGDAARIYISQRADIDNYLGLAAGNVGISTKRSAIALKADGVRIVAREGIKIVTMGKGTPNSLNQKSQTYTGIDLIAANDDKTSEPIAKAHKIATCLNAIIDSVETNSSLLEQFLNAQILFNKAMAQHIHTAPWGGAPSFIAAAAHIAWEVQQKILVNMPNASHRKKVVALRLNHLEQFTDGWIGSRYNTTN